MWAGFVAGWLAIWLLIERWARDSEYDIAFSATESLIERFGLFTIIVLGEVVVGVVTGLSEVERNFESVATEVIGLMIGFGIWWTYFDFVGRRSPRRDRSAVWMAGHLPVVMSIAASGAAMVSLIEHAGDDGSPADAAWLLGGSLAVAMGALILVMSALGDYRRLRSIYQPLTRAMVGVAALAILVAWRRPEPWVMALLLVGLLSMVWAVAVDRWLRLDDPGEARPG